MQDRAALVNPGQQQTPDTKYLRTDPEIPSKIPPANSGESSYHDQWNWEESLYLLERDYLPIWSISDFNYLIKIKYLKKHKEENKLPLLQYLFS